jgi:Tfp pilus assembly protein PilO
MKIKIIVPPLLLVVTIVFIIWFFVPQYQVLNKKSEELKVAEEKLVNIQGKSQNVAKLASDLEVNYTKKQILFDYIPLQEQEEDIISNLDYLATGEGLALYKLSLTESIDKTLPVKATDIQVGEEAIVSGDDYVAPTATDFKINLAVVGSYDKIRLFLAKVSKLNRFNYIYSINITDNNTDKISADSEKPSLSGDLMMDAVFIFKYMDNNVSVNIEDSIFSENNFDLSIIDAIKNKLTTAMNQVEVGSKGKPNPFIP